MWFVSQEQTAAFSVAGWSWVSSAPGFMEETALILSTGSVIFGCWIYVHYSL